MNPKALIGAAIGGAIGALVWFLLAYFADIQIGWIAIGIGFLVGSGSKLMGGKGVVDGIAAAGIAVAAIGGGLMLAVWALVGGIYEEQRREYDGILDQVHSHYMTMYHRYSSAKEDGKLSVRQINRIAKTTEFSLDSDPDLNAHELQVFQQEVVPILDWMHNKGKQEFAEKFYPFYRKHYLGAEEFGIWDSFSEVVSPLNYLFWAFGALFAFSTVRKEDEEELTEYDPDLAPGNYDLNHPTTGPRVGGAPNTPNAPGVGNPNVGPRVSAPNPQIQPGQPMPGAAPRPPQRRPRNTGRAQRPPLSNPQNPGQAPQHPGQSGPIVPPPRRPKPPQE